MSSIRFSRAMSSVACACGTGNNCSRQRRTEDQIGKNEEQKWKKGATAAPFSIAGEVGLPFLAGLLLPALGFLRHCVLSPPSCGCRASHRQWLPPGTLTQSQSRASCILVTRNGFSEPSSYQM